MANTPNIPVATVPISEGKPRPILETGTYFARIVQVIDLGTHQTYYQNKSTINHKYAIRFETPTEMTVFDESKGEQPFLFTSNVNFKITSKDSQMKSELDRIASATGIEAGKQFNIYELLDKVLMIEVAQETKEGRTYNYIANYVKLPKGMQVYERANELKWFSLDPQYFDQTVFEGIGKKTQEKIKESPEYQKLTGSPQTSPEMAVPSNTPLPEIDVDEINIEGMPF